MWFISSERSNVGFFFALFYFSFFISLKSGKCFIDHCLPALFLQTLNPRFRAFVGVFFASPRKSLTLRPVSPQLHCLPRLDPFSWSLQNAKDEGLILGWKQKINNNENKVWWSWICLVALLLGIILFFCFTRPVSSLRPCLDYVLTKCLGNVTVVVVSSFVRLLRRRLDSNPRAVSWECRRADLMTSWNNSLTHSRLLCTRFFLPKVPKREEKIDPNLVPVPLLLPYHH